MKIVGNRSCLMRPIRNIAISTFFCIDIGIEPIEPQPGPHSESQLHSESQPQSQSKGVTLATTGLLCWLVGALCMFAGAKWSGKYVALLRSNQVGAADANLIAASVNLTFEPQSS